MFDELQKEMVKALKAGEKERLTVLRGLKADLMKEKIDKKKEINDELVIDVASRSIKSLNESIEEFKKGNRNDLAEKAEFEKGVLSEFLPEQLSEEEVDKIIDDAFKKINPTSMKDMGSIMKEVSPKLKGRFDMSLVSSKIKGKLM